MDMTAEDFANAKRIAKWATWNTYGPEKEDQEQEVLILLWRLKSRVRPDATVKERNTLFMVSARNHVYSMFRRRRRELGQEPYAHVKARDAKQTEPPNVGEVLPDFEGEPSYDMNGILELREFLEALYEAIQGRISEDEKAAQTLRETAKVRNQAGGGADGFDGKTRVRLHRELARITKSLSPDFAAITEKLSQERLFDLMCTTWAHEANLGHGGTR